jgi:dynein heavy chain
MLCDDAMESTLRRVCSVTSLIQALDAAKTDPPGSSNTADRVASLVRSVRSTIYEWASRGMFEQHKLVLLTQIVLSLLRSGVIGSDSGFSPEAAKFLISEVMCGLVEEQREGRGPTRPLRSLLPPRHDCGECTADRVLLLAAQTPSPSPQDRSPIAWLSAAAWFDVNAMADVEALSGFVSDLETHSSRFKEWHASLTPEVEKLPLDWRELDRSPFLKLLVVRALRPDRLAPALKTFIETTLPDGAAFTQCDAQHSSMQVTWACVSSSWCCGCEECVPRRWICGQPVAAVRVVVRPRVCDGLWRAI